MRLSSFWRIGLARFFNVPLLFLFLSGAAFAEPLPLNNAPLVASHADTVWMLLSTMLVMLMALPGLALYYGGLVRSKNMLSVLMQIMVTFALIVVLWIIYGYSLTFTQGNAFFGGFDRLFLSGIWNPSTSDFALAATTTKGVYIPEILFAAFQATFAGITCCLIVGSLVERVKFSALLVFMVLWFTFAYIPIAHMVWFWNGPDAYTATSNVDKLNSEAGWLWQQGALDYAGGTVVHINSAIAGLVGAYFLGKRIGYGRESMVPHNLPLVMVGACLLWFGWFGFNAGSALQANGFAALAFINTFVAACAGMIGWLLAERALRGKASMLGAVSGLVAGLVGVTPAAGNVGVIGALVIGFLSGMAGLWGVGVLKKWLRVDDSLDVFGVHGVCGIVGALLTGVFSSQALGGPGMVTDWITGVYHNNPNGIWSQVWVQAESILVTVIWSGIVSIIAFYLVDKTIGLRVTEENERQGLDITTHGETAYNR